ALSNRSRPGSPEPGLVTHGRDVSCYGANATWLFIASKTSLASSCVDFTLPYQVEPPAFDWPAAYARIWPTVMLVAPPNAELELMNVVQVPMLVQIFVRSIDALPIGPGAPILLVPSAGSLKYTSSAVASICPLSIGVIESPAELAI